MVTGEARTVYIVWTALYNKIIKIATILNNHFWDTTDTTVLDFWWCILSVSKPKSAALFALGRGICVTHSLRFTSGVAPADLLAASMASKPISSTYMQPHTGGTQIDDLSPHRQTLYRLFYAGSMNCCVSLNCNNNHFQKSNVNFAWYLLIVRYFSWPVPRLLIKNRKEHLTCNPWKASTSE